MLKLNGNRGRNEKITLQSVNEVSGSNMSSNPEKIDNGFLYDIGCRKPDGGSASTNPSYSLAELERPIIQIDLTRISDESPFQTRQETFNPKTHLEDKELLESVRVNGVLEPIMVLAKPYQPEPHLYQTVFGHRRLAAARLANIHSIAAMVIEDEGEARFLTLAENMGSRRLTPYEKALALVRLKETCPALSVRGLGQKSGIPYQSVSTLIRAYQESPPHLRRLFVEGLTPGAVLQLKPVFEAAPEDERESLAKALRSCIS